jgi:pimeloyl-ACP methyl ester carboxylesterase
MRDAEPITLRRGFFWVGVERSAQPYGTIPRGQMYVQWEAPVEERHPFPLVLVHGGGGQGTDWLGTPDGRPGWATYLVEAGYAVYIVDRPGHGRSPFHPDALGEMGPPFPYEAAYGLFTPDDDRHTQWPDEPALDQFIAGTGPMPRDFAAAHALEQSRLAELLDRIGPAILVGHSAGGPATWLAADARPDLVKAIVAIETMGPPFLENPGLGVSLTWGLAAAPLTYDPPPADAAELLDPEPRRTLPNLSGIPIAHVCAEASPFAAFDDQTVAFLRDAGCNVERIRLAEHGVRGNGHGMMLERNNREALEVILAWLDPASERE